MESIDAQSLPRELHEVLILAAVERKARHGYEIALHIEERSGGYFTFKHGTLYPILHRLEKEGHLDGEWTRGGAGGRKRKVYRLTAEGRRRLCEGAGHLRRLHDRLTAFLADDSAA